MQCKHAAGAEASAAACVGWSPARISRNVSVRGFLAPPASCQVIRLQVRLRQHRRNKQKLLKRLAGLQGQVETLQEPWSSLRLLWRHYAVVQAVHPSPGAATESARVWQGCTAGTRKSCCQGPIIGTLTACLAAHGVGASLPAV
jgi:hypothetical protein